MDENACEKRTLKRLSNWPSSRESHQMSCHLQHCHDVEAGDKQAGFTGTARFEIRLFFERNRRRRLQQILFDGIYRSCTILWYTTFKNTLDNFKSVPCVDKSVTVGDAFEVPNRLRVTDSIEGITDILNRRATSICLYLIRRHRFHQHYTKTNVYLTITRNSFGGF